MRIEENYFPVRVPGGLSVLPVYIERLFDAAKSPRPLVILLNEHNRGFGLAREAGQTRISFAFDRSRSAELEQALRLFFTRWNLAPCCDRLARNGGIPFATRLLLYHLPGSVETVTTFCQQLLQECFGVEADDSLYLRDSLNLSPETGG